VADAHGWQVTLRESDGGGLRVEVAGAAAAEEPAATAD
jgi:hypothetical protein